MFEQQKAIAATDGPQNLIKNPNFENFASAETYPIFARTEGWGLHIATVNTSRTTFKNMILPGDGGGQRALRVSTRGYTKEWVRLLHKIDDSLIQAGDRIEISFDMQSAKSVAPIQWIGLVRTSNVKKYESVCWFKVDDLADARGKTVVRRGVLPEKVEGCEYYGVISIKPDVDAIFLSNFQLTVHSVAENAPVLEDDTVEVAPPSRPATVLRPTGNIRTGKAAGQDLPAAQPVIGAKFVKSELPKPEVVKPEPAKLELAKPELTTPELAIPELAIPELESDLEAFQAAQSPLQPESVPSEFGPAIRSGGTATPLQPSDAQDLARILCPFKTDEERAAFLNADLETAAIQMILDRDFEIDVVSGLQSDGGSGFGVDRVPADMLKFAGGFLFMEPFSFNDYKRNSWASFYARLFLHKSSRISLKALSAYAEDNEITQVKPGLKKIEKAIRKALNWNKALFLHPAFNAPNSIDHAEALFCFILGRKPTQRDDIAKIAKRGHDANVLRFLTSAEFNRIVLVPLLSGQPVKFDIQEDLSAREIECLRDILGDFPAEGQSRLQTLLERVSDPAFAAMAELAAWNEVRERLRYVFAILSAYRSLIGRTDDLRFTTIRSETPREWVVALPETCRHGRTLTLQLDVDSPTTWTGQWKFSPGQAGMIEGRVTIPMFGPPSGRAGGETHVRGLISVVAQQPDAEPEHLVSFPVTTSMSAADVTAAMERATRECGKAYFQLNSGRFREAETLLRDATMSCPLMVDPRLGLAEVRTLLQGAEAGLAKITDIEPETAESMAKLQALRARLLIAAGKNAEALEIFQGADIAPATTVHDAIMRYGAGSRDETVVSLLSGVPQWVRDRLEHVFQISNSSLRDFVFALRSDNIVSGFANDLIVALGRVFSPVGSLRDLITVGQDLGIVDCKLIVKSFRETNELFLILPALVDVLPENLGDTGAVLAVAQILERSQKIDDSMRYVDFAISRAPKDYRALNLKANLLRRKGDTVTAIECLKLVREGQGDDEKLRERMLAMEIDAVKKNPLRPRHLLHELNRLNLDAKQKALFYSPNDAKTRFDFARAKLLSGSPEEATSVFERLLEEQAGWDQPRLELLRLARDEEDAAAAFDYFQQLDAGSRNERLVISVARCLRTVGRFDDAQGLLLENAALDTGLIFSEIVRGHFFVADFVKAANEVERGLLLHGENLELRLLAAAAYLELGEYEKAFFHTTLADMAGGSELLPAEMPLFLYATAHKIGKTDLALQCLDPMFTRLSTQTVERDTRLGGDVFDQLRGTGKYSGRDFDYAPLFDGPLVSVVMTTFNVEGYVWTAVRSILEQSYRNIELIIVDDASTDSTPALLTEMERMDPRVRIVLKTTNDGTYVSKNIGLLTARGKYIALQDSDDWSHPDRLGSCISVLEKNAGIVGVTTDWLRMTSDGSIVIKAGGQISHLCCISLVFRRAEIMEKIGFFDSVRIAADLELVQRIGLAFGDDAILRLRWPLLFGRSRSDSLTASEEFGMSRFGFTEPRQRYHDASVDFHARISEGAPAYIPFPLEQRLFDAPTIILPRNS